jgi:hypothetical protein
MSADKELTPAQSARSVAAKKAIAARKERQAAEALETAHAVVNGAVAEAEDPAPAADIVDAEIVDEVVVEPDDFPQPAPVVEDPDEAIYDAPIEELPEDPNAPKPIHIHIKAESMTIAGHTRYRGEEVIIQPGSAEWPLVHHRDGRCALAETAEEQEDRWGQVMYGQGPWRGRPYDIEAKLDDGRQLTPEEQAALEKANRRRGLAPAPGR